jgi:uridine kinase
VLALDRYYRDLQHLPFEERVKINFDAPDAVENELVVQHLNEVRSGLNIEQPTYDFIRFTRAATTEPLHAAEFVIVEGLFALYWPAIRDLLDACVYIAAEHQVCLERRIFRDVRERGRTEESVRAQYYATVRPMCDRYVAPTAAYADIVLNGVDPVKQSTHTILSYVAERVRDQKHLAVYFEAV